MKPRLLTACIVALLAATATADAGTYNLPEDSPLICTHYGFDDGQELVDVWVPLIGSGTGDDTWRPDMPQGVRWASKGGMIGPVGDEFEECPVHPVSGLRRSLLTQYVGATIPYEQLAQDLDRAVPLADVPTEDALLVELARLIERDRYAKLTPEAAYNMGQLFWRERDRAREQDGYDMLMRLLQRMQRRGLPWANAREIAAGLAEFLAAGPL